MSNEEILDKNQEDADVKGETSAGVSGDASSSDSVTDGEAETPSIEELTQRLALAEQKAADNWDLLIRTKAEMENIRRRGQKDLENAHKYGLEKFVSELLAIKDSLEMGIEASQQETANIESIREGSKMTLSLLNNIFDKFNVVELDPKGEKFNADHHQAMSMLPSPNHEPNTVMDVMQKGYLLNNRLVRPAMVVVSKAE